MRSSRNVTSFEGLLQPFTREVNAWCFARTLEGDFDAIAAKFASQADDEGGLCEVTLEMLKGFDPRAVRRLKEDLRWLASLGREPQLNVLTAYAEDTRGLPMKVDVLSLHADRAPVETDTFLCTYSGACSEGADGDDVERLVDDPTMRAALREVHGRDEGFDAFLTEGSFDLHYRLKPGARAHPFGVGNLWRLAVAWPGSTSAPCIHRAPAPDGRPRLLLIS